MSADYETAMRFTVAIIGRPNVGKSTIFNRLLGKRIAIVDDQPGVTRDRRGGEGRVGDLTFRLFDTAGLEDAENESLEGRMRQQTSCRCWIGRCSVRDRCSCGRDTLDEHFARWLRREKQKVILVANKCEERPEVQGFMSPSASVLATRCRCRAWRGLNELYDALAPMHRRARMTK